MVIGRGGGRRLIIRRGHRTEADGEQLVKSPVADARNLAGLLNAPPYPPPPQMSPQLPVCCLVGRRATGKGEDHANLCLERSRSRRDLRLPRLARLVEVIGSPGLDLTTCERGRSSAMLATHGELG